MADRKRAATADVGLYRAVSYTDLSAQHFDGHPYATRRAVDQMVRHGHLQEHAARGPEGGTYTVLTATPDGARAAQRAAAHAGLTPEQQTWTGGIVKPAELAHDVAVYRAATVEQDRIETDGGRVTRVRIDAELKQIVARASEKARADGGKAAADQARAQAARDLDLPMHDGQVMYPDAQLETEDSDGRTGRVNVEIASDHYHAGPAGRPESARTPTATFVYVDAGQTSDSELRTWGQAHMPLWVALRRRTFAVHVVAVGLTATAADRAVPVLAHWTKDAADPAPPAPMGQTKADPEIRREIATLGAAIRAGDIETLRAFGGSNKALVRYHDLIELPEGTPTPQTARGVIDRYATWTTSRLLSPEASS